MHQYHPSTERRTPAGRDPDTEETCRALAADFPDWSIIHTDRGRWWAIRYPDLDPRSGEPVPRGRTEIDTDTAEELREQLERIEAEAARYGW